MFDLGGPKKHLRFFGRFLINIGYVALFEPFLYYVIMFLGLYVLRVSFQSGIMALIALMTGAAGLILWRFMDLGYGEKDNERVDIFTFIIGSLPAWAIYIFVHIVLILCKVYINSVSMIAMVMVGLPNPQELPASFYGCLVPSFIIVIAIYTAIAFVAYRLGIKRREFSRAQMFSGGNVEARIAKKMPFVKCFIPFVNIAVVFWWFIFYLIDPAKKLRRLFLRLILIFVIYVGMNLLYSAVCLVVTTKLAVIFLYWVEIYAFSTICALIAYKDEKRYQ